MYVKSSEVRKVLTQIVENRRIHVEKLVSFSNRLKEVLDLSESDIELMMKEEVVISFADYYIEVRSSADLNWKLLLCVPRPLSNGTSFITELEECDEVIRILKQELSKEE